MFAHQTDGLPPLREVIHQYQLTAKKSLGQNFLLDLNLTRRIARTAGPLDNATILEVGPGPGGLTRALLMEGAQKVIVIEQDPRFLDILHNISSAYPGKLEIIHADAICANIQEIIPKNPIKIVSNLPYNIGTQLLFKWLASPERIHSCTLMFQKEVGERLIAQPNTKAYGQISVLTQWQAKANKVFSISPKAFLPQPKIWSSIISLKFYPRPLYPADRESLYKVVKTAFSKRRKMLRQSLKGLESHVNIDTLLSTANIQTTRRAEDLSIQEFCTLAQVYKRVK